MRQASSFWWVAGIGVCFGVALSHEAIAFDHSHAVWKGLLKENVKVLNEGRVTRVNYAGLKKSPEQLEEYTRSLSKVSAQEFSGFSYNQRKAFLINAYNAFLVKIVVDKHPIKSIKHVGIPLVGPWKSRFIPLLGKNLSPDDIEHSMLRREYADPRIHFAVNCASVGCPALRPDAFVAQRLDAQLEEQAKLFFSNPREVSFDKAKKVLRLSSILRWFKEDFVSPGDHSPVTYVAKYLPSLANELSSGRLRAADVNVEFLEYDWSLNESL